MKKLFPIFLLFIFLGNLYCLPSFAASGGIECRISGGIDRTGEKIRTTDGLVLISSIDNTLHFETSAESTVKDKNLLITLAVDLLDVNFDSLLSREVFTSKDNETELSIEESGENGNSELVNLTEDENGNPIKSLVLLQILKYRGDKVSGNIKVRFPKTVVKSLDVASDQFDEENDEAAPDKVVITCKFTDILLQSEDF